MAGTVAIANDANTNLLSQPYKMWPLIKRGKGVMGFL